MCNIVNTIQHQTKILKKGRNFTESIKARVRWKIGFEINNSLSYKEQKFHCHFKKLRSLSERYLNCIYFILTSEKVTVNWFMIS